MIWLHSIDPLNKFHNVRIPYLTMYHFISEMCTCVHISGTKCGALWYVYLIHCGIWEMGLYIHRVPRWIHSVCALLCFVMAKYRSILPISFKVTSLALTQPCKCPYASKETWRILLKYHLAIWYRSQNETKHDKQYAYVMGYAVKYHIFGNAIYVITHMVYILLWYSFDVVQSIVIHTECLSHKHGCGKLSNTYTNVQLKLEWLKEINFRLGIIYIQIGSHWNCARKNWIFISLTKNT